MKLSCLLFFYIFFELYEKKKFSMFCFICFDEVRCVKLLLFLVSCFILVELYLIMYFCYLLIVCMLILAFFRGYVGIHSSGFRDFLLKPELLRAIVDSGFEHPSEGKLSAPLYLVYCCCCFLV